MNNGRFQQRQEFMRDTVSRNNIAGEYRRHHYYETRHNGGDHSQPVCASYNDYYYANDFTNGDYRDNYGNDNFAFYEEDADASYHYNHRDNSIDTDEYNNNHHDEDYVDHNYNDNDRFHSDDDNCFTAFGENHVINPVNYTDSHRDDGLYNDNYFGNDDYEDHFDTGDNNNGYLDNDDDVDGIDNSEQCNYSGVYGNTRNHQNGNNQQYRDDEFIQSVRHLY